MNEYLSTVSGNCDRDRLAILATRFRRAIEKCDKKSLPAFLKTFPLGSCGDACYLLAKYLQDNGCGKFDRVFGNREGQGHAWLQQGQITVDITADQFHDQKNAPVIVSDVDGWHSQFKFERIETADYSVLDDPHTVSVLSRSYNEIIRHI